MIWGAITYYGVGRLVFIDTRMDSELYVAILRSGYAQTLEMHSMDIQGSIFQQDNDSKHMSKYTREYLFSVSMRLLNWPSCSPDMNPIEHVWAYLKRAIFLEPARPQSIADLKALIVRLWYSIPLEYIQGLYRSMPNRVDALLASKVSYTKY